MVRELLDYYEDLINIFRFKVSIADMDSLATNIGARSVKDPVLVVRGVTKAFFTVRALKGVDFDLFPGEVHAIVGENGAGKSTLIKILCGAERRDGGEIYLYGDLVEDINPRKALDLGIATIYQERTLVPHMTVAENLLLGREPVFARGVIKWQTLMAKSSEIIDTLRLDIDPTALVSGLGAAKQQSVEIAKAMSMKARIVIMDEPTASLGRGEISHLFDMVRHLKDSGIAVIYISHRIEEVFEIADRVTVLRDGMKIGTYGIREISPESLVPLMVGKEVEFIYATDHTPGEVILELRKVSKEPALRDVSFSLRTGEILGIAGMVGSGRTELARVIAGADPLDGGTLTFRGKEYLPRSPIDAIRRGICLLPEERKDEGLVLGMSVTANATLPRLDKVSRAFLIQPGRELLMMRGIAQILNIRSSALREEVQYLSGGNQQKVVFAKWLFSGADVLILDEPTKGVDVAAKEEIHQIMKNLVEQGKAILMISSDMMELLHMSNRILVMNRGRIAAEIPRREATKERVLAHAIGKSEAAKGE